jgi:hypothetical protein
MCGGGAHVGLALCVDGAFTVCSCSFPTQDGYDGTFDWRQVLPDGGPACTNIVLSGDAGAGGADVKNVDAPGEAAHDAAVTE